MYWEKNLRQKKRFTRKLIYSGHDFLLHDRVSSFNVFYLSMTDLRYYDLYWPPHGLLNSLFDGKVLMFSDWKKITVHSVFNYWVPGQQRLVLHRVNVAKKHRYFKGFSIVYRNVDGEGLPLFGYYSRLGVTDEYLKNN